MRFIHTDFLQHEVLIMLLRFKDITPICSAYHLILQDIMTINGTIVISLLIFYSLIL